MKVNYEKGNEGKARVKGKVTLQELEKSFALGESSHWFALLN